MHKALYCFPPPFDFHTSFIPESTRALHKIQNIAYIFPRASLALDVNRWDRPNWTYGPELLLLDLGMKSLLPDFDIAKLLIQ